MNVVLFLTSNAKTNATTEQLAGIRDIAAKLSWNVVSATIPQRQQDLKKLLDFWSPIGIVCECGECEWSNRLDFGSRPAVYLDRDPMTLPHGSFCVLHDSLDAGRIAARHLLLLGYEHYAFVPYPVPFPWSQDRARGFQEALRLNGRDCRIMTSKAKNVDSLSFQKDLKRFLQELPQPCAVFVANDRPAESLLIQAQQLGLRVPEEMSVLGVDNYEPLCERTSPTLSSVRPDFRRGGSLAALMLAAVLRDGRRFRGARVRHYGSLGIVRRRSTQKPLVHADHETNQAIDLINSQACNGLRAEEVMRCYSCSRPMAARKFRAATGQTILSAIHAIQIERAKSLLTDPGMGLKTIHSFCGISSASTLRKLFLRETGQTMTAWRRDR